MGHYVPHSNEEIHRMLSALGLSSTEELFDVVPDALRLRGGLDLPDGLAEPDALDELERLGTANTGSGLVCFAGGGAYDHDIPSVVSALAFRSEFVTAYTPYQAEVSQGVLQALFEYQTFVCRLTGMEVANASLYDGASACVEAVNLGVAVSGRPMAWVSQGVHPHWRAVLRTFAAGTGHELRETGLAGGLTAWPASGGERERPGALLVQYPNYLGCLEDLEAAAQVARAHDAPLLVAFDPVAAGVLRSPGSYGADVVVGEGQPFGTPLSFGGPYLGLFACRREHVRRLPGRLVGETVDTEGRRAYVTTLRTREQDIRREKASSNVCTNQTLIAVAAAVHLGWLGTGGLRELGLRCGRGTRYLRDTLLGIDGVEPLVGAPVFREFAIRTPVAPGTVLERMADQGVLAGVALEGEYGEGLLVSVTERRTRSQLDAYAAALAKAIGATAPSGPPMGAGPAPGTDRSPAGPVEGGGSAGGGTGSGGATGAPGGSGAPGGRATSAPLMGRAAEPTIFELSEPGRRSWSFRSTGTPSWTLEELLPEAHRRAVPPALAEVSERDLVAHFTRLSHRQYSVDLGAYPLGSCTMKYNPKACDRAVSDPRLAALHPTAGADLAQGWLALLDALAGALCRITGMHAATLQPPAGAAGELTGLLLMRAWHASSARRPRKIIIPDSAHGTNPASVSLGGYEAVTVPSDDRGCVDLVALRQRLDDDVAGMMLTNPNTLGLFEESIAEMADAVHEVGGLLYYDGANLNAILGITRPGDMGFDIVHLNLHKTFAVPHGGGGPGAGPVAVSERLAPFLPGPTPARAEGGRWCWATPESSIGRVHGWHGNALALARAWCYLLLIGGDGLRRVADAAVLNANWLRHRLRGSYDIPYDRPSMHEFVASMAGARKRTGLRAVDVAKRLLEEGFHAPTVYFPLIVEEALMIEPTETESLQTLEALARALERIAAGETADARAAPRTTPVSRVDEARAARSLVPTWDARRPD